MKNSTSLLNLNISNNPIHHPFASHKNLVLVRDKDRTKDNKEASAPVEDENLAIVTSDKQQSPRKAHTYPFLGHVKYQLKFKNMLLARWLGLAGKASFLFIILWIHSLIISLFTVEDKDMEEDSSCVSNLQLAVKETRTQMKEEEEELIGLECISEMLKESNSLVWLAMSSVNLSQENGSNLNTITSLSNAIASSSSLTWLDLSNNKIDPISIVPLADALDHAKPHNNRAASLALLTSLDLRANILQDEGVAYLSRCLANNRTITHLDLDMNGITDKGCKDIGSLIAARDSVLCTLSLVSNRIEGNGLLEIANSLENNVSLTKLSLERNPFDKDAAQAFWAILAGQNMQRGNAVDVDFLQIVI